jgi:hypothetical protein
MLGHGLATDASRTLQCPATSRVSSAPLGLVSSMSFNRRCKEKNKIFTNVDRYSFLHVLRVATQPQSFCLISAVIEKYNFSSKSFNADTQSTVLLSVMHQEMPESHHWQLHRLGIWLILQLVSICYPCLWQKNLT